MFYKEHAKRSLHLGNKGNTPLHNVWATSFHHLLSILHLYIFYFISFIAFISAVPSNHLVSTLVEETFLIFQINHIHSKFLFLEIDCNDDFLQVSQLKLLRLNCRLLHCGLLWEKACLGIWDEPTTWAGESSQQSVQFFISFHSR